MPENNDIIRDMWENPEKYKPYAKIKANDFIEKMDDFLARGDAFLNELRAGRPVREKTLNEEECHALAKAYESVEGYGKYDGNSVLCYYDGKDNLICSHVPTEEESEEKTFELSDKYWKLVSDTRKFPGMKKNPLVIKLRKIFIHNEGEN